MIQDWVAIIKAHAKNESVLAPRSVNVMDKLQLVAEIERLRALVNELGGDWRI